MDSSCWVASNSSGYTPKDGKPSPAPVKCWSPLGSEESEKHFTGCTDPCWLKGWKSIPECSKGLDRIQPFFVCFCSKSSFHWIQRKMLELGPYIFAKRARYLWPPSAVHSTITRIKLSVKCTVPDPVRLSTCSINYIKSNNNFHWNTGRHFFTEGYSLGKSWLSEASCFRTWAVQKKAALDFIFIIIGGRSGREECFFLQSLCSL